MRPDISLLGGRVVAAAATDPLGGRIAVAAIGVVIGVLPGGYLFYRMSRRKTREASTTDLSDVNGYGWSTFAQQTTFVVGGFVLTSVGLGIVALAIWLPKGTTTAGHHSRRAGVPISSPWAWVLIGLAFAIVGAWALLSRSDGRMKPKSPSYSNEPQLEQSPEESDR